MASPLVAALMDPNNIGMSEADHGGFGSTADKLKQGFIGKVFHGLATLPARAGQAAVDYGDPLKGTYDPAPIMEGAMMAVGTPGVPAGAIGSGIGRGRTVRPPTDSIYDVANANFSHGAPIGNRTMPIDNLVGGAGASEAARVQELAQKIAHPDGYISRLIVDDVGNVIEGQHRLSALRSLGEKTVPVSVIKDLERGLNTDAALNAVRSVGGLHPDHVHQIMRRALEAVRDSGSPAKALAEYSMPPQFQPHFEAALKAMK
jgi:hypothetical protein